MLKDYCRPASVTADCPITESKGQLGGTAQNLGLGSLSKPDVYRGRVTVRLALQIYSLPRVIRDVCRGLGECWSIWLQFAYHSDNGKSNHSQCTSSFWSLLDS